MAKKMKLRLNQDYDEQNKASKLVQVLQVMQDDRFGGGVAVYTVLEGQSLPVWLSIQWFTTYKAKTTK